MAPTEGRQSGADYNRGFPQCRGIGNYFGKGAAARQLPDSVMLRSSLARP